MSYAAALLGLLVAGAPLGALTGLGARRRGSSMPVAMLAALCYPVAWAVWYVRDEHPYRAAG